MEALTDTRSIEEATALVVAIEQAAARLKQGAADDAETGALAHSIVAHVHHERSKVRQAVAEAARHLPDEAFEASIGLLLADASRWVKSAAKRSFDERSRRTKTVRTQIESTAEMRALRAKLAKDHGEKAARAAQQFRDMALEQFVERLHHELVKVGSLLHMDMGDLRAETQRAGNDALLARTNAAFGKLDVLLGIVNAARVHAEVAKPTFREENVREFVNEQTALFRARIGDERRARLRLDVTCSAELVLEMDRALLGQALSNLLQNAVEAYPEGGDAEISVRVVAEPRKGGTIVALLVEDRGRGIPAAMADRVGEPYVSTKGAGRGLGTLNVKKMVEAVHGGVVTLESPAGGGTRVTLTLPRVQ